MSFGCEALTLRSPQYWKSFDKGAELSAFGSWKGVCVSHSVCLLVSSVRNCLVMFKNKNKEVK